jgi:outer membrane protein OmpA-like peptidoglycan-associated protein
MKKMSLGLYGIGLALLFTSCVAKKKYVEAQNKISQLEQQNTNCLAKTDSLNTNISSLQQSNSELQGRYDSSMRAYSTQQTRMNDYTGYYVKQKSSADQMHTTLHQQLDEKIGATNIVLHNNKVFITLPEATLFNSGSTTLSTKGTDIINTLASNIAQNPDVEVYVATLATDPATGVVLAEDNGTGVDATLNANASATDYNANVKSTYKKPATAKKSNSSYAAKSSTTKSGTTYKAESTKKTMKSNYAKKSVKPGVSSNSMAVARASTIVSTLRQQGVQKAGIQVTDPVNRTSTKARKYQVIVSPSMEGYQEMMGKGDLGTGMK